MICFFSEKLSLNEGDLELTAIDLGGHRQVRRVWREYYDAVDAVVFMVDAADTDPGRIEEARVELQSLLTDDGLMRRRIPIAILANKVDAKVTKEAIPINLLIR